MTTTSATTRLDTTHPLIGLPVTVRYDNGDYPAYVVPGTLVGTVDDESVWVIERSDPDEPNIWALPDDVDIVDFFGDVPVSDLPTNIDESDDGWLDI
jgi:hypothetical protein